MSRPKRSEPTRLALIEEGACQLAANGYHGTGIKQILDAVEVPKGSFYNYFESKEAFVKAIIEDYTDRNIELFNRFIEKSTLPAMDKLRAVNDHMFTQFEQTDCQRGCLVGSIAAEIGASSALCQSALDASRSRWQACVARLMAEAQAVQALRTDISADRMAEMYWATWEGALIRMRLDGRTDAARAIIDTTLALLRPSNP